MRDAKSTHRIPTWLVALLLLAFAAGPRLVSLGELSFYADEDISVLAADGVLDGRGATLPSGMEYRRALPLTWLHAAAAAVSGSDSERVIRLPSALLGALTVPALFLLGRRWVGVGPALIGALLLGVSEWHLVFSRQARMYAPTLCFLVLGTWGLWSWTRTGDRKALAGGLVAGVTAMFFHQLGTIVAGTPLVWLAYSGAVAVPVSAVLLVSGILAVAGLAIGNLWTGAPYRELPMPSPLDGAAPADGLVEASALSPWLVVPLVLAGVALALRIHLTMPGPSDDEPGRELRRVTRAALAATVGVAAGLGQTYGFALAGALYFLMDGASLRGALRRSWLTMAGLVAVLLLPVGVWTLDVGIVEALEASASFPYPHAYTLAQQSPVFVLAFGATCLYLVISPSRSRHRGVGACAIFAIAAIAAIGLLRGEVPTRYLLPAYPMMVLVVGGGLFLASRAVLGLVGGGLSEPRRGFAAALLAGAVALSGLVAGHGVPAVAKVVGLRHGERVNPILHMYPFRPDHRSVGRYVREHRRPGDVVVAEDPLIQGWYAGEIDYWFRRYGDMRRYLRIWPDGETRDIYVGSEPLWEPARLDSIARGSAGRVWLITSGETASRPLFYHSPDQRDWFRALRGSTEPAHLGEDGVSEVFCLNCANERPDGSLTPP